MPRYRYLPGPYLIRPPSSWSLLLPAGAGTFFPTSIRTYLTLALPLISTSSPATHSNLSPSSPTSFRPFRLRDIHFAGLELSSLFTCSPPVIFGIFGFYLGRSFESLGLLFFGGIVLLALRLYLERVGLFGAIHRRQTLFENFNLLGLTHSPPSFYLNNSTPPSLSSSSNQRRDRYINLRSSIRLSPNHPQSCSTAWLCYLPRTRVVALAISADLFRFRDVPRENNPGSTTHLDIRRDMNSTI